MRSSFLQVRRSVPYISDIFHYGMKRANHGAASTEDIDHHNHSVSSAS